MPALHVQRVLWWLLLVHVVQLPPSNCVTSSPAGSRRSASGGDGSSASIDVAVGTDLADDSSDVQPSLDNSDALALSRGHAILLEKGLQVQAMAFPWISQTTPGFSVGRFEESNFTGLSFWEAPYPVDILGNLSSRMKPQWSRFTQDNASLVL